MEYGIMSSDIRNHMDENLALKREEIEEENPRPIRAQQQQVKVLKFPTFDDDDDDVDDDHYDRLRMSERDLESDLAGKQLPEEEEEEEQEQAGNYVLRMNPKKSERFVDSKELNVCKECGKGFQSLKALCGHMASHSDKERVRKGFKEGKAAVDGYSDTESSGPKKRRVSKKKRIRIKSVSGSVVEIEQQEVAISLMLLSRDFSYKGCQSNSIAESSSNGSVVLEPKIDVIRNKELKPNPKMSDSENSDSGYFENGPKKNESDVSVDGFSRTAEFKNLEVKSGSGFVDAKLGNKNDRDREEIRGSAKYELRKRTKNGNRKTKTPFSGYFVDEADYATSNGEIYRNTQKKSKYECLTCNKTFPSHTALGGHRASHAKTVNVNNGQNNYGSICESGENSIETVDISDKLVRDVKTPPKKVKGHECPICFRMFKSGQALGGHKRSHFLGGREANSSSLMRQGPTHEPEIAVLFDLNLPAPTEEEPDVNVGFMKW